MRFLSLFLALSAGCKKVEPAPADLDSLFHWFWANFEAAESADIGEAADDLHAVVDGGSLDEVMDGSITLMSDAEVAAVSFQGPAPDPSTAAGMFLVNAFDCRLAHLEDLLSYPDQDTLYEGVYDRYDRSYTSDRDAFASGQSDTLSWEVDYEATLLGATYQSLLSGGLRRAEGGPGGAVLMARTWLLEPADFEEGSSKSFPQDFQIEVFYERAPGEILHAYGLWREMELGGGLSLNDEGSVRIILNNLADWDDQTETLCAEGRP